MQLVEVNAHSLFSKWFSESGKLVNKLFGTITELVEDPEVSSLVSNTLHKVTQIALKPQDLSKT